MLLAALLVFGCFPGLLAQKIEPRVADIVTQATAGIPSATSVAATPLRN
jgi:hypothetical protein